MQNRCGNCGAWLLPGAEVCDTCHSRTGPSGPGRIDLDDPLRGGDDLGDLELDLPAAAPPARRPARAPGAAEHGGLGGDPLDPLGAAPGGASLELDLAAPVRRPPPAVADDAPDRGRVAGPGASARGMALYDVEVQTLADYGRAPDGILGAIPYTLHVLSRRHQLKVALGSVTTRRQAADAAARRALVDLGREILARADMLELGEIAPHVTAARRQAGELDERARTANAERAEIEGRTRELEGRVQSAQADVSPWRDKETRLRTQLETREAELERSKAHLRRAEIEIRNATRPAQQAAASPDPDRVAALEAEREARAAEVAIAEGPVRDLTRELGEVRRELAAKLSVVGQLDDERRALEEAMRRAESLHRAGTGAASRELEEALLRLGEEAHLRGLDQPLGPASAKAQAALAGLEERRRAEALHGRALDAYDKPAFKKGAAILGGAALVVLVMLVFVIVR